MLSETHIIANAKLQNVFGSLRVIISSDFNTKLVNISIDWAGRSSSHLIMLTYDLHIQQDLTCLLISCSRTSLKAPGAAHVRAHTLTPRSGGFSPEFYLTSQLLE